MFGRYCKVLVPRLLPTLITVPMKESVMGAAVAGAMATPTESKPYNIRLSPADSFNRLIVFMVVSLIMLVLV